MSALACGEINTIHSLPCVKSTAPFAAYSRCTCACVVRSADIDECVERTAGCEQSCENSNGSFVCSCSGGYTLNQDNATCTIGKSPDDVSTVSIGRERSRGGYDWSKEVT